MWMAGGGIKGGKVIGATDEIGLRAVEDKVPHARHPRDDAVAAGPRPPQAHVPLQGREQRLTDVGGDNDLAARLIKA